MKIALFFSLVLSLNSLSAYSATKEVDQVKTCRSAREYITTVSFLRDQKEYELKDSQVLKIADDVSKGCSGASKRFINVLKLLTKMGIDTSSSIKSALQFVDKEDAYTKVFVEIYRKAYDPKYLDLDVHASMKISLKLSAEYQGSADKSLNDFNALVEFCLKNKSMDLPAPKCADIATKITSIGHEYEDEIAPAFIDLIDFLQEDSSGPKLNRTDALKVGEEVISFGPIAKDNFEQAYKFATDKEGLDFKIPKAIEFAKTIASRSKLKSIK